MSKPTYPTAAAATGALHAPELQFLLPEARTNTRAVFGGASLSWSVFLIGLAILMWTQPNGSIRNALPSLESPDLIYVQELGLGRAGGTGGGNKSPDPPRMSPTPKITAVEAAPIPVATVEPVIEPEPIITAQVPAMTGTTLALLGPSSNTDSLSRGLGDGDGAGPKNGPGNGTGDRPGFGLGPDPRGGDVQRPGPDIVNPTLISSAKPSYTSEAMIRRIHGIVLLDCVVSRNGTVDSCTIARSLDSIYGLDEQAIKAAKQFRFTPGRKQGAPAPVLVRIEILFNMR